MSGTATFNGKPIAKGYINFYPADGKGKPVGGEIKDGKYSVSGVTPGKNRVEVSSQSETPVSDSMEDSVKAAKKAKIPDDVVAAGDEGNGQTHEIASGSSELNLAIKTKSSSDGKR